MQGPGPRRAMNQGTGRGSRAWFVYLMVGLVTTGVYFFLPSAGAQSVLWDLFGFSAVVAILLGVHVHRARQPGPWYVLAFGLLLFLTGDVIWNYYENFLGTDAPVPSVADGLYIAALPCMALGLVLMLRVATSGPQWGSLIDILIVTSVAGTLSWIFLIEPNIADQTRSLVERLVAVTYPLMDLVLLAAVLRLLLTSKKGLPAHYLLSASMLILLIADTGYGWIQLTSNYDTGNPIDAGYLLFYTLLGAAGLHPSMANLTDSEPHVEPRLTWQRLALLTATLLIAPVMLAYQAILGYDVNVALIVGSSAVLFLLVAVRMAGMIGERKVLEQRLEFQAMHDPLTHLPNRSLFRDRLELALARTERQGSKKVAVMYVDIDDFKEINDSLGHEAGDKVLLAVAQRLQRCLRPADTVARLGGDEFVVLLEEVQDAPGAVDVAERILESVRAPVVLSMMETRISVSIGITLGDGGHERPADLLRKADLALYSAKGRGKDGYEVFEPGLGERLNL